MVEEGLVATQRGWLDAERKQKRTLLSVSGILVMILSLLVFIFSLAAGGLILSGNPAWLPLGAVVAGISAALFILSIPWLVYGATFSILTSTGEEQAVRWKGFSLSKIGCLTDPIDGKH